MWLFWIAALLPITVGAFLLFFDKEIDWREWIISTIIALLMAGIFQMVAAIGLTHDIQTLSGVITQTAHYGEWVEEYEEMHTRTVGSGKDEHIEIYYTTEHATHSEHWDVDRNFGKIVDSPEVSQQFHLQVKQSFGNTIDETLTQGCTHGGHYDGGDQNYYVTHNNTHYIWPVTTTKSFKNKVKAAPSLFSYSKVPTNINVYPWPENPDWNNSDRLLGSAKSLVTTRDWDIMNSYLGPMKKVNLIMVGFPAGSSISMGRWQEANWIGGKKNDVVICFAGGSKTEPAEWAYVFGWTEKNIVKENLKSILLENPINNDLIPKIKDEIIKNYVIKDWTKFDYITVQPPTWSYWFYFILMVVIQAGLYVWFHLNSLNSYGKSYWGSSWWNRLINLRS